MYLCIDLVRRLYSSWYQTYVAEYVRLISQKVQGDVEQNKTGRSIKNLVVASLAATFTIQPLYVDYRLTSQKKEGQKIKHAMRHTYDLPVIFQFYL
jgi:hypothetical protein